MYALNCLVFTSLKLDLIRSFGAGVGDVRFQITLRCERCLAMFALNCRLVVLVFTSLKLDRIRSSGAGLGDVRFHTNTTRERLGAMFALQIVRLVFLRWLRITICKNNVEKNSNRMTREQTVEETC